MNVLIVDDSTSIRNLIRAFVEEMGHKVIEAVDGAEAIGLFQNNRIDFVLMDVEMPGMNGFETTRKLRSIDPDYWFPIVFLSAKDDSAHFVEGIESGGDAYLSKPVNGPVLRAMVRAMARIANMQEQLLEATKNMELLANQDQLTGLTNRRGFDEAFHLMLERSFRNSTTLAMLMIDIDFFKQYNDNYGHICGDKCLQKIAQIISNNLLASSDTISRYGGEEFAILIPNVNPDKIKIIAKRLCEAVQQAQIPNLGSHFGTLTISIGCAIMQNQETEEDIIARADAALYQAKHNGKNQYQIAHPS